jgi:hypothetical protein
MRKSDSEGSLLCRAWMRADEAADGPRGENEEVEGSEFVRVLGKVLW